MNKFPRRKISLCGCTLQNRDGAGDPDLALGNFEMESHINAK